MNQPAIWERQKERLSKCQRSVYIASKKLIAYGILLRRQGIEHEGFTELEGLGMELESLGERLELTAHRLDLVSIGFAKLEHQRKKDESIASI